MVLRVPCESIVQPQKGPGPTNCEAQPKILCTMMNNLFLRLDERHVPAEIHGHSF